MSSVASSVVKIMNMDTQTGQLRIEVRGTSTVDVSMTTFIHVGRFRSAVAAQLLILLPRYTRHEWDGIVFRALRSFRTEMDLGSAERAGRSNGRVHTPEPTGHWPI